MSLASLVPCWVASSHGFAYRFFGTVSFLIYEVISGVDEAREIAGLPVVIAVLESTHFIFSDGFVHYL